MTNAVEKLRSGQTPKFAAQAIDAVTVISRIAAHHQSLKQIVRSRALKTHFRSQLSQGQGAMLAQKLQQGQTTAQGLNRRLNG